MLVTVFVPLRYLTPGAAYNINTTNSNNIYISGFKCLVITSSVTASIMEMSRKPMHNKGTCCNLLRSLLVHECM